MKSVDNYLGFKVQGFSVRKLDPKMDTKDLDNDFGFRVSV